MLFLKDVRGVTMGIRRHLRGLDFGSSTAALETVRKWKYCNLKLNS